MDVIRVLTIHQETATRARLRRLVEEEPDLELVGEGADTVNTAPFIRKYQPHVVFLQAPFEEDHTIRLIERMQGAFPPLFVFVSADNEYAVRAFETRAFDFLHEPFTDTRFGQTLARARERLNEYQIIAHSNRLLHLLQRYVEADPSPSARASPTPYEERLVVKTGNRLIFLDLDDVDWIESESVYVRLHAGEKSYLLRESLHNVEARLNPRQFIRIHRSTMVNVLRIKEIVPHANGGAIVILRDGHRLKLSRSYRHRVHATLG